MSSPRTSAEWTAIAHAELDRASDGLRWSRILQRLTLCLSTGSIFTQSNALSYLLALATLLSQFASWGLRWRALERQRAGEALLRTALLTDALGPLGDGIDFANLLYSVNLEATALAEKPAGTAYFDSDAPRGMKRLLENLQENAFWNKTLYRISAARVTQYSAVFWAAILLATFLGLAFVPGAKTLTLLRVLIAFMSFGAVLTQVGEILAWRSAKEASENLDQRLERLVGCSNDELARKTSLLMMLFADYCIVIARTPPIPKAIYDRENDRLNRLWSERKSHSSREDRPTVSA